MPPKVKITKADILMAAADIVRQQGEGALNARQLAQCLGCSTQPIFSNYDSMEQLRNDVIVFAWKMYRQYSQKEMESARYPPYKAFGMAYIRFAKEERELFRLLFMRSRTPEDLHSGTDDIKDIITIIQNNTGLSYEMASLFHLEMWIFVHGVASMLVTSYLNWDWAFISNMLTDMYEGLKARYAVKG